MNTVCFLFIYIFEQFIAYIYFSKKFDFKKNFNLVIILYSISFIIQFFLNSFQTPYLNLLSFFLCNIFVVIIGYKTKIKQAVFNVIVLEGFMITTELFIMFLISILLDVHLIDFSNNSTVIILETLASKTLYFSLAYITSKISIKHKEDYNIRDFSYILFVLPLVSIFVIICFVYLSIQLNINQIIYYLFTIIALSLLVSNIIIFLVHERIKKTLILNTELQLATQKNEISKEHYQELERQYDLSNLLIHDIKKHLDVIKNLAIQGRDTHNIVKYVNSVYDCYEVKTLRRFSNNKLVNVIISRYAHLCNLENIELLVDIRNIDFDFISESDLTSLLDNLLANAFETAKNSANKIINIVIDKKNEHYVIFNVLNSCDTEPPKEGDYYVTAKKDKSRHGYGLKSIDRITKKYDGNSLYKYNQYDCEFVSSIILKSNH